jgi:hypothetical protein
MSREKWRDLIYGDFFYDLSPKTPRNQQQAVSCEPEQEHDPVIGHDMQDRGRDHMVGL